jgi:hypothetical protein
MNKEQQKLNALPNVPENNILFQRKDKEGYYREHLENRGISVKLRVGNCFLIQVNI